ncbi:hypothetical protein NHX12_029164, partial [Muraenolepis orangiensis]
MVENTSISTKSAVQASFSSANNHPLLATPAATPGHLPAPTLQTSHTQHSSGGMKLEAVMENLQRQQAARLALEEKLRLAEKEKSLRSMVESQIHQQALAFRHYQAAVRGAFAAGVGDGGSPAGLSSTERQLALAHMGVHRLDGKPRDGERDPAEEDTGIMEDDEEDEDTESGFGHYPPLHGGLQAATRSPRNLAGPLGPRIPPSSPGASLSQNHEWTYEEQFKQ